MSIMDTHITENVKKLVDVINNNKTTQQLMTNLSHRAELKGLTPEEWEKVKQRMFIELYFSIPELKNQFCKDLYEELRG